jgi:hypothetical protein
MEDTRGQTAAPFHIEDSVVSVTIHCTEAKVNTVHDLLAQALAFAKDQARNEMSLPSGRSART